MIKKLATCVSLIFFLLSLSASSVAAQTSPSPTPDSQLDSDLIQLLVTEYPDVKNGYINMDFFVRGKVAVPREGRVVLMPLVSSHNQDYNQLRLEVIKAQDDPWAFLNTQYQTSFSTSDTVAELAGQPQIFNKFNRDLLPQYLERYQATLSANQQFLADQQLAGDGQLAVIVFKDGSLIPGTWTPIFKFHGSEQPIQEMNLPFNWLSDRPIRLDYVVDYELGLMTHDPFQAVNPRFTQHVYDVKNELFPARIFDFTMNNYLSELYFDVAPNDTQVLRINREYPENAKVEPLKYGPGYVKLTPQEAEVALDLPIESGTATNPVETFLATIKKYWQQIVSFLTEKLTPPEPTEPEEVITQPTYLWSGNGASLKAESITITTPTTTFVPPTENIRMNIGGNEEFAVLEADWQEGDIPMRLYFTFLSDGQKWWVADLKTYDGQLEGDWVSYVQPEKQLWPTALDTTYTNDSVTLTSLDGTYQLQFTGLTLGAFNYKKPKHTSTQGYYLSQNPSDPLVLEVGTQNHLSMILRGSDGKAITDQTTFRYHWEIVDQKLATITGQETIDLFAECCNTYSIAPFPYVPATINALSEGVTKFKVSVTDTQTGETVVESTFDLEIKENI